MELRLHVHIALSVEALILIAILARLFGYG